MGISRLWMGVMGMALLSLLPGGARAEEHRWQPVCDRVYLQEVGRKIPTDFPLLSVALFNGEVYTGSENGLLRLAGDNLVDASGPAGPVRRLAVLQGGLWAINRAGLHRLRDNTWQTLYEGDVHAICEHLGEIYFATTSSLMVIHADHPEPVQGAKINRQLMAMTSYSETLYFLYPGKLALFDGQKIDGENVVDWGFLPSSGCRDMMVHGSRLTIASERGLVVLRGMALTSVTGKEGLCFEDTTCLAEGFDNDLWIGTKLGAIRSVSGEYQFFGAQRWLPGDEVNAIICGPRTVYLATEGGLGIIDYESFTLQKKAAYYERHLEEWGQKRLGFVHKLLRDEAREEWVREISDNDGGWTAHYLAAMSFKYAVTKDEADRREAVDSFLSLKWLVDITPIPGFPARAIWVKGEKGVQSMSGSGGFPAEWHDTADGLWEWKGDTSSDEVNAHFFAIPVFYDLAAGEKEKQLAKEHLARVAGHIVDNGWVLRDLDGYPTRWGRWDPEYLQRPIGFYARGLNAMEALSYVQTAMALSDDPKFEEAREELLKEGYLDDVLRQKLTFPPSNITHFDDELAFYVYYPLLKTTSDPYLRSIYRRSLDRSWEVGRIQQNPWFNYVYGSLTGNDCEEAEAAQHLREWPLDLIKYSYHNSHRHDLRSRSGYEPYSGVTVALSPRETGGRRWDASLEYDREANAVEVEDPSGWLNAYWMGRYYGFITPPETEDPDLTTVPRRGLQLGAAPYEGPPRPE